MSFLETAFTQRKHSRCSFIADRKNLDELRALTGSLEIRKEAIPLYKKTEKNITELSIYEQENIEIQYIAAGKGVVFPMHAHDGKETIAISKGEIECMLHGVSCKYKEGDFIFITKNSKHSITVIEDTIMLFVLLRTGSRIGNE